MPFTAPLAIDGLVTLLRARSGLTGVHVADGIATEGVFDELITVGDPDGDPTIEGTFEPRPGHVKDSREDFALLGLVRVKVSDPSEVGQRAARLRAFALLQEIADALLADRTLGGVVLFAQLASFRLVQSAWNAGDNGREARIHFSVNVQSTA